MRKLMVIAFLLCSITACAEFPAGAEVLMKVDENMAADSSIVTSKMIIHSQRETRTVESKSWAKGDRNAYTEYLSPVRERGTKMLKLGERLWMYSPGTDRIIQISGHMLRQSVMGSDLSYEDMMENPRLAEIYDATVTGQETIASRSCWIVKLVARQEDIAYHSRILWVDQERFVPVKEELFAKSGKLLKRTELRSFKMIDKRWYPMHMTFKDVLKTGQGTEFVIDTIEFNVPIPEHLLSKAALRR